MILKSTAAKAGTAGVAITGGGLSGAYLARDYINYYEVERKIMNGEGSLEVVISGSDWKIKTKDKDAWKENDESKYYWECVVSGTTTPALNKVDFELRLLSIFGLDTKEARQRLVYLCSRDRGSKKSSNQIKSKLTAPSHLTTKGEFLDYLFGTNPLKQVEKEVIEKDLKFTVTTPTEANNKKITITTPTEAATEPKLEQNHTWSCEIDVTTSGTNIDTSWKTKLDKNLFTSGSIDDTKRFNKALLVTACSKNRVTTNLTETTVKGTLEAKEDSSNPKNLSFENENLADLLKEASAG